MRKLLFASVALTFLACGTSEDSVETNADSAADTTVTRADSLKVDLPLEDDSTRAIHHGSPDQEKLDSIKRAKAEEKKKK